ncbi:cysteine-rich receptor-like protein kinase 6 [Aegilops tauschii subsp. strangulata]|uniref:cysteine-rich receptor-like protein kinase 6 n=1 Tax=Aegilops tauschii subsp. strangulata TaxID=200361 RepID=UPI003CC83D0A
MGPSGQIRGQYALIRLSNRFATLRLRVVKVFDATVGMLINATADYAATNSSRRFGTGEEGFETIDKAKPKIYGLVRPDMSPADCRGCLTDIITYIPQYFTGRQGGRILGLRCNCRYEQYPFFTGPSLL